ncbi:hypothetical protein ACFY2R_28760 [Micromonospora olivasterospora]|uniref:hypothetical protein n=1 Tax=Micromonospora olivasterospora TaxID=1880 RepID=UPI00367F6961
MAKVPHAAGYLLLQLEQATVTKLVFESSVEDPVGAVGRVGIPEFRKTDAFFAGHPEMNRNLIALYGQSEETEEKLLGAAHHHAQHLALVACLEDVDVERKVVTEIRRFLLPEVVRIEAVEVSAVFSEFVGLLVVGRVGAFTDDRELAVEGFPQDGPVLGVGRMGIVLRPPDPLPQQNACVVEQLIESLLLVFGYRYPGETLSDTASAFDIGWVR